MPAPPAPDLVRSVRGVRDWLPDDFEVVAILRERLLDAFRLAGCREVDLPVLEHAELHERRSGGRILSKLFAFDDRRRRRLCLRPEITASALRAIGQAKWDRPPEWPMRLCYAGKVFRYEKPGRLRWREFTQVGFEVLGAPGPAIDAEVCALALDACTAVGFDDATLRVGHIGVVTEMLASLGLPPRIVTLVLELIDDAATATDDIDADALTARIEDLASWGLSDGNAGTDAVTDFADSPLSDAALAEVVTAVHPRGEPIVGRRTREEIVARWRWKRSALARLKDELIACRDLLLRLGALTGAPADVLPELRKVAADVAPRALEDITTLVQLLDAAGLVADKNAAGRSRVKLHFGFGRGLQFYSGMICDIGVRDSDNRSTQLGGGGRYDGFATMLGSPHDPHGVGFFLGLERIHRLLQERNALPTADPQPALLLDPAEGAHGDALRIARDLRAAGQRVVVSGGTEAARKHDGVILARVECDGEACRVILGERVLDGNTRLTATDITS